MDLIDIEIKGLTIVLSIALLIAYILFVVSLQNTLKLIKYKNRLMQPGSVWLTLIPVFNYFWQFVLVYRVTHSIKNELRTKGVLVNHSSFLATGRAACIFGCVAIINELAIVCGLCSVACWIAFWYKVNSHRKQILHLQDQDEDSIIFGSTSN
jgi:heme/copper-type cytochrome/quinol oxidase subunit 2